MIKNLLCATLVGFFSLPSLALVTELGVSYGHKKTTLDTSNYFENESTTGSVSFYVADRVALELSYTTATGVQQQTVGSDKQTVVQTTQATGADLIFIFSPNKSLFQPYIKGGGAQIKKFQTVKVNSLNSYTVEPETAISPSYGAGLKITLTETLGIKLSYDVWRTPIGGGTFSDDSNIRAGITWML